MAWFANYGSEGHREAGLNWDEDSAVMSRRYKQDWSFMTTGISDIPIDRLYCETRSVIALDKDYWNRHLNMVSTIQTLYDDTDAADIIHFYGLNRSRPALSIRHLFLSNRGRARMVGRPPHRGVEGRQAPPRRRQSARHAGLRGRALVQVKVQVRV